MDIYVTNRTSVSSKVGLVIKEVRQLFYENRVCVNVNAAG